MIRDASSSINVSVRYFISIIFNYENAYLIITIKSFSSIKAIKFLKSSR